MTLVKPASISALKLCNAFFGVSSTSTATISSPLWTATSADFPFITRSIFALEISLRIIFCYVCLPPDMLERALPWRKFIFLRFAHDPISFLRKHEHLHPAAKLFSKVNRELNCQAISNEAVLRPRAFIGRQEQVFLFFPVRQRFG